MQVLNKGYIKIKAEVSIVTIIVGRIIRIITPLINFSHVINPKNLNCHM